MKATKLPSGNWRVRAFIGTDDDGKQIIKSFTGPDRKQVLREAAEFIDAHRDTSTSSTFQAASESYLNSDAKLSPTTLRGYTGINKRLIAVFPAFVSIPCHLIGANDIQAVLDALARSGASAKTVRNYYGYMCSVMKYKRLRMPIVELPKKAKPQLTIPSEEDVQIILDNAWNNDREMWVCLALATTGPLRIGEIAALKYTYDDDVDFTHNTIHVSHDYEPGPDGSWHLKEPKTPSSDRVLIMPQIVMDEIKKQGYVTNLRPQVIYRRFVAICKKEGLPHYRFHDLRHYCASMLHAKGYPDAYIQARTGHSTMEVLRSVYTHTLTEESARINAEMLSNFNDLLT